MKSTKNHIEKAKLWADNILGNKDDSQSLDAADIKDIESLKSGKYENWRNEVTNLFEEEKVWDSVEKKITVFAPRSETRRLINYWQSVAAVLILAVIGSAGYILFEEFRQIEQEQFIMPGKAMAYLQVDDNKVIELNKVDTLLLFNKIKANLDSGRIVYSEAESTKEAVEYHKINVPRNGEYYVQLSDETKVWVNSESSISFKSRFDGKQRVVELSGEAYFEVAKNPDQPFIVRTDNMDIRVLGTHFNVKAYPDEEYTYATLNEGKICVNKDDLNEVLAPNQQLALNNMSKEFSKQEVDASIYSAWVKGKFVFKDEKLEDILIALSRWYDIKIFYENARLKEDRFSISVNRYDDINILLDHLKLTGGINFEINKNALIVK